LATNGDWGMNCAMTSRPLCVSVVIPSCFRIGRPPEKGAHRSWPDASDVCH
jgi:hypothetical protein